MGVNPAGIHAVRLTTTFLLMSLVGSPEALRVIVSLDVMEISVWNDEGDHGNGPHSNGRVVDALRA
jgi:hypothetical protein